MMKQGLEVIEYAYEQLSKRELSPLDVNAFLTPGLFSKRDEEDLLLDIERYHAKLRDPKTKARSTMLRISGTFGGTREVPAISVRNVQNSDDSARVIHFKDWARGDFERADPEGYIFLCVYSTISGADCRGRCILSVKPDQRVFLKGLGAALEVAEVEKRRALYSADDRLHDSRGEILPARPGYENPDPWYDGRRHGYTIIDSPRSGSVLTADEIEAVTLEFCQSELKSFESISELLADDHLSSEAKMTMMTDFARGETTPDPDDIGKRIFISYSHRDAEWVKTRVYKPLNDALGDESVFSMSIL